MTTAPVYGTDADVARWLLTTGLRQRYGYLNSNRWRRWDGTAWVPCPQTDVHQAVRLALEAVYDRAMATDPSPGDALLRLMDVRWRLGPLMRELRRAAALQPEAV